jgi:hypothetical protein
MKRILVVGCSHGVHADPKALAAVLKFKREFRPHTVVHLGDFVDTTAFRGGCAGTSDEMEPVEPDIDGGLDFLKRLGEGLSRGGLIVLEGNHEHRLYEMAKSPSAVKAHCAGEIIRRIETRVALSKGVLYPWRGVFGGVRLGNFQFFHGSVFGENATRDMAEMHGNVVHAHTHRPAIATGRRDDFPIGIGVGTLTRRAEAGYAKSRRATLGWGQGFVWGEYDDRTAHLQLCLGPNDQNESSEWMLP